MSICENYEPETGLYDKQKEEMLDLLDKTVKFLRKNKIEFWIDGGTLLGAMRNGKMIPWDDDIDLAVPEKSFIKLHNLAKSYEKQVNKYKHPKMDLLIYIRDIDLDGLAKKHPSLFKDKYLLIRTYHTYKSKIFIDLIYYKQKGKYLLSNSKEWENIYKFHINDLYPLRRKKFENKCLPCPNNPTQYLNNAYWFWKHLGVVHHSHLKKNVDSINKQLYFIIDDKDKQMLDDC